MTGARKNSLIAGDLDARVNVINSILEIQCYEEIMKIHSVLQIQSQRRALGVPLNKSEKKGVVRVPVY